MGDVGNDISLQNQVATNRRAKLSKTFQNLVEFYFREKILSLSKGQFYNIFKVSMPQYISVALEPKINL